jgi:hypothetical protein
MARIIPASPSRQKNAVKKDDKKAGRTRLFSDAE